MSREREPLAWGVRRSDGPVIATFFCEAPAKEAAGTLYEVVPLFPEDAALRAEVSEVMVSLRTSGIAGMSGVDCYKLADKLRLALFPEERHE